MMQTVDTAVAGDVIEEPIGSEVRVAAGFVQEFQGLMWAAEPLPQLFEKVERAKKEWEATVDSLPELICLIDQEGHVLRTNQTIKQWNLGRVTSVQACDLHTLIHPRCASPLCDLRQVLDQGRLLAGLGRPAEREFYDKILRRHVQVRIRPILTYKDSAYNNIVVVMEDVTERKQAEEAMQRYTARLEALNEISQAILAAGSPEAIAQAALVRLRRLVRFDQARVSLMLAPAAHEFLIVAADANGETHLRPSRPVPASAFGDDAGRHPDQAYIINDLAQLPHLSLVEQGLLVEGLHAYLSIPMVAEGECIGALSLGSRTAGTFSVDDSQIAQEVADLLAIATRQARLLGNLAATNGQLKVALKARDLMVRNVSHELRTPLTVIRAYAEMLCENELGALSPEQTEALAVMQRQGERLHLMIERLLQLQSFNAEALDLQPVDLETWLNEAVEDWKAYAAHLGETVQFDMGSLGQEPYVLADTHALRAVLVNLLDNALKFSPTGSRVRLGTRVEDGQAIVSVSDQGIGIAPEDLSAVFQSFYQADASLKRTSGGIGIGLTLCREIVEAHGGRIWAESPGLGRGSSFHLALPLVEPAATNRGEP